MILALLLPLACLIGFGSLAIGGRATRIGVIAAAILAGVVVVLVLVGAA